jgi:serine/threonine-protein kinase
VIDLGERYAVEHELGHGGMARVFLARDLKHGRRVALKVLRPEHAASIGPERFLREIRVAAGLTHPNILPLHDSGEVDGLLFYVMPYIEGESLRGRLDRQGRLAIGEAVQLGREVADALDYAHQQGVVHRDIKPENILISNEHAVVADFGIARAVSAGPEHLTDEGLLVGTPLYMSPEQAAGDPDLDGRSDIYSLGCVMFETLTGMPPFSGPTAQALLMRRLTQTPDSVRVLRPETSVALADVVARALARHPSDRFATAAGLSAALGAAISGGAAAPASPMRIPSEPGAVVAVAVLPFENMSVDKENEYFSDGMTEELINALAGVSGLRVTPRTSVIALRGQAHDVRAIGERLRVSAVVEGSVRQAGNRLRIATQLIDTVSGYHLWAETFERRMEDVFAIQDEISRAIVGKLRVTLAIGTETAVFKPGTESLDAYQRYLKGRYFWNQRTLESIHKGIEHFERASDVDPRYPLPYTGVADSYHLLAVFGAVAPHVAYPRAKAAALRALELDPLSAEAHTSRGCVAFAYEWDWTGAEREFLRAIELKPSYAFARLWYAWCLTATSRPQEAVATIRKAIELEPLSKSINGVAGYILLFCGLTDEAIEQCQKALDLDPSFEIALDALGSAYAWKGMYDEAMRTGHQYTSTMRASLSMKVGVMLAAMGEREEAIRVVREEEARQAAGGERGNSGYYVAAILAMLGERDRALGWLQREVEDHRFTACLMNIDPRLVNLRSEPRFHSMVERMGLGPS